MQNRRLTGPRGYTQNSSDKRRGAGVCGHSTETSVGTSHGGGGGGGSDTSVLAGTHNGVVSRGNSSGDNGGSSTVTRGDTEGVMWQCTNTLAGVLSLRGNNEQAAKLRQTVLDYERQVLPTTPILHAVWAV
jgi:hypothetical protein